MEDRLLEDPFVIQLFSRLHFPIHHWSPPIAGNQGETQTVRVHAACRKDTSTYVLLFLGALCFECPAQRPIESIIRVTPK